MPATFTDDAPTIGTAPKRVQATEATGLDIPYEPRFMFMFDASRADIFLTSAGPEILPNLIQVPEIPGCLGVTEAQGQDGAMAIVSTRAVMWHGDRRAERVPLKLAKEAFGRPVDDYCLGWPAKNGRTSYRMAWFSYGTVGSRVSKKFDADGYHNFLRRVRDHFLGSAGFDRVIVDELRERLTRECMLLAQVPDQRRTAGQTANLAIYQAKLKVFDPKPSNAKSEKAAA